ncbi:hypothetical protein RN001_002672 [Aquatica leii]|uniref:DDE Tnp4 domain-containing protein n=1 Tax=Aquatica leii TaxID=1421715 RepID=A0AAN7PQ53_9COLE|nr:hypothetical protein RN001_002672 [Aquatica leii]
MYPSLFNKLLNLVGPKLEKNKIKNPISAMHRLIVTLQCCSMQDLAYSRMLGKTTVANIIKETTIVLWNVLQPIYLKPPTREALLNMSEVFHRKWNLPHCIGAIDGKHVVIQAPPMTGSVYSYDAEYRFTFVDVGTPGGEHDQSVFRSSEFGDNILNNKLELPYMKNVPNAEIQFPYFFVADAAFPLHTNIMRPYPGEKLPERQKIFNYRLSRARRTIENAFGILSQRWRVLRKPIVASVELCENITLACVVLHNFIKFNEDVAPSSDKTYCPPGFADVDKSDGTVTSGTWRHNTSESCFRSIGRVGSNNPKVNYKIARDILCEYVNSPGGSVPWQEETIWRSALPKAV